MDYSVKEIFYTLQGEGANSGQAAVFCRFSGCNLWSGREKHRASAICRFCDTDFVGVNGVNGGKFSNALALAKAVMAVIPAQTQSMPLLVCSGGEPLLQLDETLIAAFHEQGLKIAVESNGTLPVPKGIDWLCISPKAGSELKVSSGDELKLVFPQNGAEPERFEHLDFKHFFLQPMDGPEKEYNTRLAINHCLTRPRWRLSLQTHKLLGIP